MFLAFASRRPRSESGPDCRRAARDSASRSAARGLYVSGSLLDLRAYAEELPELEIRVRLTEERLSCGERLPGCARVTLPMEEACDSAKSASDRAFVFQGPVDCERRIIVLAGPVQFPAILIPRKARGGRDRDLDPYHGGTFVESECGDDLGLRDEVLSLVAACERSPEIHEPPTAWLGVLRGLEPPRFLEGDHVANRYHIKALLGRGGMGEVYEAWDEELSILVALKTLHLPGATEDAHKLRSAQRSRTRATSSCLDLPSMERLIKATPTFSPTS